MTKTVIIIGGGIAGMEAASILARRGIEVALIEKEDQLGGHLRQWDRLFPNRRKSDEVVHFIENQMNDGISVHLNTVITGIQKLDGSFLVKFDGKEDLSADALLLATGFDLFDCRKKEEYGYGIYDNVMTSADVEKIFRSGKMISTVEGKKTRQSRDHSLCRFKG